MPRRTHRILCRFGFLTFCLLPTLLVGGWIVNERVIEGSPSPAVEAAARPIAEAELSRLLGLKVTLERISYPQTGVTLLENVTIADPETGGRIAAVPALEMAKTESGLELIATRPEIDAERWRLLWESLHDRVLRERGETISPAHLTARQAMLVSDRPDRSPSFSDVEIRLASGNAAIEFRLAGAESPHRMRFRANRERSATPPYTRWELHTGESTLPCSLFADRLPWLARLGAGCGFNGSLWAEETAAGWQGEVTGRFLDVDLDRLVSEQFPHKLSGSAKVTFSRLEFEGGRIRQAAGWLDAGPGTISRGLLSGGQETFALRSDARESVKTLSRYARLAFGFELDEVGVRLSGGCDPEGTLLILEDDPQSRFLDRHAHVTPIASLVRMLAPANEVQVPAAKETDALLRILPLPPIKRPEPVADAAPQARVRFSEDR
jgi:hypothetical protein